MDSSWSYCWWLKSCTTKDDDYPNIYRALTIPDGVQDFFQSTVVVSSRQGFVVCQKWSLLSMTCDCNAWRKRLGVWFLFKKNTRKRTGTWKYTKLVQVVLFKRFYLVSDVFFCLVDPNVDCLFWFLSSFSNKKRKWVFKTQFIVNTRGLWKKSPKKPEFQGSTSIKKNCSNCR